MQKERFSREEFLTMFTEDVIRLSKYIPWLEEKSGADVSKNYEDGDKMAHTLSFPVYDSILLAFLNDASTTVFMEKNYHYFYTKNHVQDFVDELNLIEKADIMHMDILQCILSRYVFGGMVKAYLWKDGVDHQIFINILKKAKQIVEFWSEPLIIEDEIPPEGYPEEEVFEYPEVDEADWTDEEFAAVLAGTLDPNDIPRLHYEREHGVAAGAADGIVYPEVDEDDWTDEEFAAVLAGTLDPNDIPRLRYEKEHAAATVAEPVEEIAVEVETEEAVVQTETDIAEAAEEIAEEAETEEAVMQTEADIAEPIEETTAEEIPVESVAEEIVEAESTEEIAEEAETEEAVVQTEADTAETIEEATAEEVPTEPVAEETVATEPPVESAEETTAEEPPAEPAPKKRTRKKTTKTSAKSEDKAAEKTEKTAKSSAKTTKKRTTKKSAPSGETEHDKEPDAVAEASDKNETNAETEQN